MGLRLLVSALALTFATAGPVVRDVGTCAQECAGDSKFQYSEKTTYVYSYEASNTLEMEGSSELSTSLKAKVEITRLSKCEMALQIVDVKVRHGSSVETTSAYIANLQRHPLRFSWNDGKISNICPHPGESDEANNIKRGILSVFQNSMKTLSHDSILRETDVLGSCDTDYKVKDHGVEKITIHKTKNLASCTNHLKGSTGFTVDYYESPGSPFQHFPFMTDKSYACHQIITNGLVEEIFCSEKGSFKPLHDYGYVAKARSEAKLQMLDKKPMQLPLDKALHQKETLEFVYEPKKYENRGTELVTTLRELCTKSKGLLDKDVGLIIPRLVHLIRGLDAQSVESIYASLKSKTLCQESKLAGIYVDAAKAAASGGAVGFLTKLVKSGELPAAETMLWLAAMPFAAHPEEEAIQASAPLIKSDVGLRQAMLSVPAMAHKFCLMHSGCESLPGVNSVISNLKEYLGENCQSSTSSEEEKIIDALKGFGNLGYLGEAKETIFKCAASASNSIPLRISALEAFRRSPCSESISSKLIEFFENVNEVDEFRLAAVIALSKCPSPQIIHRLGKDYSVEKSKQVEVYLWSYLTTLAETSDPLKQKAKFAASQLSLKKPDSVDITKFSKNIEISRFTEELNSGYAVESNLIYSQDSFLPRSGNVNMNVDIFGYQLNLLEIGVRAENMEYTLERLFGPKGLISKQIFPPSVYKPNAEGSSPDVYNNRIQGFRDKVNIKPKHPPKASYYIRVLGNEMRWRNFDSQTKLGDFNLQQLLNEFSDFKKIDLGQTFMFLENSFLIPSLTGRAYKLAANGSATLSQTGNVKMNVQSLNRGNVQFLLGNKGGQPSVAVGISATMTIHSEDYEPGLKVATTMSAGIDYAGEINVKKGPSIDVKFNLPQDNLDIFSLKREFYEFDLNGERPLKKARTKDLNYCTKYINQITGLQLCGNLRVPYDVDSDSKPIISFLGPLEASVKLSKTDTSINGYEFSFRLPESISDSRREYMLHFDTPNSSIDRKFSAHLVVNAGDSGTHTAAFRFYTPFYSLDVDGSCTVKSDKLDAKIAIIGDKTRKYSLDLKVEKDIKGARLAEYKPTLTVKLPKRNPVQFTGTVVFARGRKEQISVIVNSNSFGGSEFLIKGNIAKEGTFGQLDSEFQLISDININAMEKKYKLYGTYKRVTTDINFHMGFDYYPEGKSLQHLKLKGSVQNVNLGSPLSFSMENEVLLSQYPDYNSKFRWDFSAKAPSFLKNDITLRYGKDFKDDEHLIQLTQINRIEGNFVNLHDMGIENKLALKIPCIKFDKAAFFTITWNFKDKPKLFSEIGLKFDEDKYTKMEYSLESYNRFGERPIKMTTEIKLLYFEYEFLYRDELQETSTNLLQGRSVIKPFTEKQITIDYVYAIKTIDKVFYHELECAIIVPGRLIPIQQKVQLKYSQNVLEFGSRTDTGGQSPYIVDIKINKNGPSETFLNLPFLKGNLKVNKLRQHMTLEADFETTGREKRHIVSTGRYTPGDPEKLELEIAWDADRDPQKKLVLNAKSNREADGRAITANVNYAESINIEVHGKVKDNLFFGPHDMRADFSGNMDPMSIVVRHEIVGYQMQSFLKYLRSEVEKLRADLKGKLIRRELHFEFESGLLLTSPYRAFDGKEIYLNLLLDSNDASRSLGAEYRLKSGPTIGYVGKAEYRRKRGWPGHVKANALVTVHRAVVFEGIAALEYGGGKYSLKTSIVPAPNKKMNFVTSVEAAARYAAFHHSLETSLQHLQLISLNAVADMRTKEDFNLQSNFDVNAYKVFDLNATLTTRSVTDFEGKVILIGKLTPSIHVFTKAHNANSLTKYSLNLERNSNDILTAKGEIKKRKKGFGGDLVFSYKGKDFLTVNINNEVKSQRERNYIFKFKSLIRSYTMSIHWLKDKKTVKHSIALCRNENDNCINTVIAHKENDGRHEWQVNYKRADVDLNFDRVIADTPTTFHRSLVLHSGGKRYGYEVKLGKEDIARVFYFALIFPTRKMSISSKAAFGVPEPSITLEVQADAENHPERKLTIDVKGDNQIATNLPSKLQITISHPIFEKPIELNAIADYDGSRTKVLQAEISMDYSLDPEDKIIAKISAEKLADRTLKINTDIYHKDDTNLDFQVKFDFKYTEEVGDYGMKWIWTDENNEEKTSDLRIKRLRKERKLSVSLKRPKVDFALDAHAVPSENLLDESSTISITMTYNGETTKSNLVTDNSRRCRVLNIFGADGKITRKVEMCNDIRSPVMFSLKTSSLEDDLWVFDYSFEIIRSKFGALNIRNHWNPEFFGGVVFQFSTLSGELADAGLGRLPIAESPRYKLMKNSLDSKIIQPVQKFLSDGTTKLNNEFIAEKEFIKEKIYQYINNLPSSAYMRRLFKVFKPTFDEIYDASAEYWQEVKDEIRRICEYLKSSCEELRNRLKDRCASTPECRLLGKAIMEMNWRNFLEAVRSLISRLPEPIRIYVERDGKIEIWLRKAYATVKSYAEPVLQSPAMQRALQQMEEFADVLESHYAKAVQIALQKFREYKGELMKHKTVAKILAFFSRDFNTIMNDIQKFDYKELYEDLRRAVEDYLTNFSLPSIRSFFKINALDTERGVLDVDISFPINLSIVQRLLNRLYSLIFRSAELAQNTNWSTLLILLKRFNELHFIPPYKEQAIIMGQHHYVTFDKTFYDFEGECAYLLASDLEDGNFSVVITPTFSLNADRSGTKQLSLGVFGKDAAVVINLSDKSVKAGEEVVELPYLTNDMSVTREGNLILVDGNNGLEVRCHTVYDVCTAAMSGWYFGKTAGLWGTYDYEPANDFKRPRGQIPNSVTTFAKSWDISKGCKTKNLVQDVKIDKSNENYKTCQEYFRGSSSPLSACFTEVKPDEYLALCYRYLVHNTDKLKSLCNVAAAYVMECEKNFIELNMPPKCLTCESPDGSKMKQGDRKKFSSLRHTSADTIFVIEAESCNENHLRDIDNLVKSVDRELTNEGLNNNMYGIVVYRDTEQPLMHTAGGNVLFGVGDVTDTVRRIQLSKAAKAAVPLSALQLAVKYPFRSGTSKSIILFSCSRCLYDYTSFVYPVIQQILLEHDIILHVVQNQEIRIRKQSTKEKNVIGADADTVYHFKDITQKVLVGEPALRSQVILPKDACVALAQDVNGSFFSSQSFSKDMKSWRSIFSRRLVKTMPKTSCSLCDCTSTADHVAKVVCHPCETKRPRLPFSVCNFTVCNTAQRFTFYYHFLHGLFAQIL